MVEQDRRISSILRFNVEELGCGDRAIIAQADALGPAALAQAPRDCDIVFIDPPYLMMGDQRMRSAVLEQVARLESVLADKAWIVLRTPSLLTSEETSIPPFQGPELHEYGEDMFVYLFFNDRTPTD